MKCSSLIAGSILAVLVASSARAHEHLVWEGWKPDVFAKAKAEGRFVILDLEAVWCHWCHVMEATTYSDPKVVELLRSKYVTVRVDQDANPDLSNRYGDWGWPATIIFAPDGTELVKRRGYVPPEGMAALLEAVIADPTPGPSVTADIDVVPSASAVLTVQQRTALATRSEEAFDEKFGGWGDVQKFIDADAMDWLLMRTEAGDGAAAAQARLTFDAARALIDPVWGGIYQYSDATDWRSPHYEKIMWYQANGLRQYAQAYGLWKDPKDLAAAANLYRYLTTKMMSPEGAFNTSQDADVDADMSGKDFYAMDATARAALGREPRIDRAIYARENGWAISALVAYSNAVRDSAALAAAEKAAASIVATRRGTDGAFTHGADNRGGPYLGDTLAMGQAALDLYGATGKREWLTLAADTGRIIDTRFKDATGGFLTTLTAESSFLKPVKLVDEQSQVARFANRLHRTIGGDTFQGLAEHAIRYLTAEAILDQPRPMPGLLLADRELSTDPTHITIVGRKSDAAAMLLHETARAYPAAYKRLDWWDTSEGPLPNPDVTYPQLDQAAAFICTNRICSLPMFTPQDLTATVQRLSAPKPPPRT